MGASSAVARDVGPRHPYPQRRRPLGGAQCRAPGRLQGQRGVRPRDPNLSSRPADSTPSAKRTPNPQSVFMARRARPRLPARVAGAGGAAFCGGHGGQLAVGDPRHGVERIEVHAVLRTQNRVAGSAVIVQPASLRATAGARPSMPRPTVAIGVGPSGVRLARSGAPRGRGRAAPS